MVAHPSMRTFLEVISTFPTLVFTALVLLVFAYWIIVVLSGFGSDVGEGVGEALLEGAEDPTPVLDSVGSSAAFLGWLGLGRAPVSVLLSGWLIAAWMASYVLTRWTQPFWSEGPFTMLLQAALGISALALTAPVPHFIGARLGPLLQSPPSEGRTDLVGRICRIDTQSVDLGFGQARLEESGDWRVVQVRAHPGQFARHDQALIVEWDESLDAFKVEPLTNSNPKSDLEHTPIPGPS